MENYVWTVYLYGLVQVHTNELGEELVKLDTKLYRTKEEAETAYNRLNKLVNSPEISYKIQEYFFEIPT